VVSEQLQGFLLHRRAYRETSYLADIFTLEQGKISAVVKGVRGSKSDKKSLLQSFQPLLVSFSGRQELRNLNLLEAAGGMLRLHGPQLFSAMYINEVLNRLLAKEVPHPEIFVLYQQTLALLQNTLQIEPCLRQFELCLLDDLGYGFDLTHEYEKGHPVEPDALYCFVIEQGIKRVYQKTPGAHHFLGQALLQANDYQWNKASLHCAKGITRMALGYLLGPKPITSRELFKPVGT
jgi:DNA repair protein RecO (recombination protein O)